MKSVLSREIGGKQVEENNGGKFVSVRHALFSYIDKEGLESQASYGVRWDCLTERLLKHKLKFD